MEWIGEIPEDWEIEKLKHVSTINKDSLPENFDPDYEFSYLDISNVSNTGKVLNTELMRFEDAPSRARRIPQTHDTIISTVRTYLKAIAYLDDIPDNFIVSTGFSVLNPEKNIFPRYLYYLVSSDLFVQTVVAYSKGIAYPAINSSDLANLPIWYPDTKTQHQISSFLDKKTSEIDLTIEKDTRLIELLKEKRTALINHVVTKGLDPVVKMKDSGVEWIGEIPEDWDISRLKFLAQLFGRIGFRGYNVADLVAEGEGALTIGGKHVSKNNELNLSDPEYLSWEKYYESPEIMVKKGDVVITQRGTLGKVVLIEEDIGPATINPSMILIKNIKL